MVSGKFRLYVEAPRAGSLAATPVRATVAGELGALEATVRVPVRIGRGETDRQAGPEIERGRGGERESGIGWRYFGEISPALELGRRLGDRCVGTSDVGSKVDVPGGIDGQANHRGGRAL